MSLIPTADQGAPNGNYFALRSFGGMVDPVVVPAAAGVSQTAALTINNGLVNADPNRMAVTHYVTASTGGGLTAGHYQAFLYGTSVGGNNIGELFDSAGLGNNYTVISLNRGYPLDPARLGVITGTGAPQNVAVPSIVLGSQVVVSYVGGAAALAAPPVIAVTPNTGFAITLPAGAIYNYEVIG